MLALVDGNKPVPSFALPARLKATTSVERSEVESQNVAGILRGSDPKRRDEFVVVSAHLDHLGIGGAVNGDTIYNGAMDNASGVASLIDMAQTFHDNKQSFKRSVAFVAVTGEEKGLLGSRYFAAHPTVSGPIVADLNMDMFLPLYPFKILLVMGLDESDLGDIARQVAKASGIAVQADPEPQRNRFVRSDQYSFIRQGIPALAFKDGYEPNTPEAEIARKWIAERYHAPSDDLQQPVDKQAAADFNRLLARIAETVANRPERPQWKETSFFRRFAKETK
jgi:Zn-dependent M28 family amino/carboxypeptidase